MARKKKEDTNQNKDPVEKYLQDKFGENIIVTTDYVTSNKPVIVPISPMIDGILNGGIPFGSFVIGTGPPKVGKTSLFLDIGATALDIPTEFDQERRLYYLSVEGRLNNRDLSGIHHLVHHLGTERVKIIKSDIGNIRSAEEFLDTAEYLINNKPGSIFIIDSFSQLCSQAGREKEWDGKAYRDNVPIMLSLFCKRISNVIPVNKCIVMGITHQIANTGPGFSSWAEASGTKVQYQVDVKLKATHNTAWKDGDTKVGVDVNWECLCSPLHNGPVEDPKCVSKFRFGYGVDKVAELINIAVDLGIITKGGAWYALPDGSKYQGLEKTIAAIEYGSELYNDINKQYREMMDLPC